LKRYRALGVKVRNVDHDENHYALFFSISDYIKNSFKENCSELLEKVSAMYKVRYLDLYLMKIEWED